LTIQPRFDQAAGFAEGLAAVKVGDRWGYIDQTGRIVIQPRFDYADPFVENLALIEVKDKWGYTASPNRG
jgi:hypothetical protein